MSAVASSAPRADPAKSPSLSFPLRTLSGTSRNFSTRSPFSVSLGQRFVADPILVPRFEYLDQPRRLETLYRVSPLTILADILPSTRMLARPFQRAQHRIVQPDLPAVIGDRGHPASLSRQIDHHIPQLWHMLTLEGWPSFSPHPLQCVRTGKNRFKKRANACLIGLPSVMSRKLVLRSMGLGVS